MNKLIHHSSLRVHRSVWVIYRNIDSKSNRIEETKMIIGCKMSINLMTKVKSIVMTKTTSRKSMQRDWNKTNRQLSDFYS